MKIGATAALLAATVLCAFGAVSEAQAATKIFTDVSIGNEANFERPAQTVANSYCKFMVNGTVNSYRYLGWSKPHFGAESMYRFSAIVCQY